MVASLALIAWLVYRLVGSGPALVAEQRRGDALEKQRDKFSELADMNKATAMDLARRLTRMAAARNEALTKEGDDVAAEILADPGVDAINSVLAGMPGARPADRAPARDGGSQAAPVQPTDAPTAPGDRRNPGTR